MAGVGRVDPADFADLDFIPVALGVLLLLTLRVAAIDDVRSLIDLAVLTVIGLALWNVLTRADRGGGGEAS